jgi:protein-disulfide isomerase
MEEYGDKVRLVFRDYPLAMHNNAQISAEAAQCAHDQGKFWDYHDKLFANQRELDKESLKRYAGELELDAEAFNTCLDSGKFTTQIQQEMQEGSRAGVSGTPAFFINGRFLSGAQPYEAFARIIDEELESAGVN